MTEPLINQIMSLKNASMEALLAHYKEVFGQEAPSTRNKVAIWRRIAYRMQEIEYGGLSSEAKAKLETLIEKYDPVNNKSLRPKATNPEPGRRKHPSRDRRLPIPGAIIKKEYKGRPLEIKVLEKGFEYEGKIYRSLSAIAKAITGIHWNGYLFFKQ